MSVRWTCSKISASGSTGSRITRTTTKRFGSTLRHRGPEAEAVRPLSPPEPLTESGRRLPNLREELRVAHAVYRSARAQRRYLIWRAAQEGVTHAEIAEIVGV